MTTKTVLSTQRACTLDGGSVAVRMHAMSSGADTGTVAVRLYSPHSPGGLDAGVQMSANEARRLAFELLRHAKASEGATDATADPMPETAA